MLSNQTLSLEVWTKDYQPLIEKKKANEDLNPAKLLLNTWYDSQKNEYLNRVIKNICHN